MRRLPHARVQPLGGGHETALRPERHLLLLCHRRAVDHKLRLLKLVLVRRFVLIEALAVV
eukprot:COSAG06_NODE_22668_length_716_cov_1.084279_2_plen_59_part_01